jgi:FkbM family methyltransferase
MADYFKRIFRTAQTLFPGGEKLKFATQRAIHRIRGTPFDNDFRGLLLFNLDINKPLLDIGGNWGQSIFDLRLFLPNNMILSFEPNPDLAKGLASRFQHDSCVRVFPVGLASELREQALFVPTYNGWCFDGLASFDEREASEWLEERLYFFSPKRLKLKKLKCITKPLDTLDLDPAFIKIDVQGFEKEVVVGGAKTIASSLPVLLIENARDQSYENILFEMGYIRAAYKAKEHRFEIGAKGEINTFYFVKQKS